MTADFDLDPQNRPTQQQGPSIHFDTSQMKSSYSNVCTVNVTREEFVLNFGLNHAWDQNHGEVIVELGHRLILSPFVALRLMLTLKAALNDYEARYGALVPPPPVEVPEGSA